MMVVKVHIQWCYSLALLYGALLILHRRPTTVHVHWRLSTCGRQSSDIRATAGDRCIRDMWSTWSRKCGLWVTIATLLLCAWQLHVMSICTRKSALYIYKGCFDFVNICLLFIYVQSVCILQNYINEVFRGMLIYWTTESPFRNVYMTRIDGSSLFF